jgi:hypothetical protein
MNEDSIRVVIAVATGIVAISTASIFIKLSSVMLTPWSSLRTDLDWPH